MRELVRGLPLKEYVRVGPSEIAFTRRGRGEPALFLHGLPTHGFLWRHVAAALEHRLHVIAPDLPGLGDTVVSPYEDFTLPMQAEQMLELLDGLGIERAVVVGHDVGGGVAQILATLRPERVRALVLVDAVGFDAWPVPQIVRYQRLGRIPMLPAAGRHLAPIVARSRRFGMNSGTWSQSGLPKIALREYLRPLRSRDGWLRFQRFLVGLDNRATRDLPLEHLDVPSLVVWGADDPHLPVALGRRLAAELPRSTLRVLGWCGHWVPEERPAELVDAVSSVLDRLDA